VQSVNVANNIRRFFSGCSTNSGKNKLIVAVGSSGSYNAAIFSLNATNTPNPRFCSMYKFMSSTIVVMMGHIIHHSDRTNGSKGMENTTRKGDTQRWMQKKYLKQNMKPI
jgi:hypothetical protein